MSCFWISSYYHIGRNACSSFSLICRTISHKFCKLKILCLGQIHGILEQEAWNVSLKSGLRKRTRTSVTRRQHHTFSDSERFILTWLTQVWPRHCRPFLTFFAPLGRLLWPSLISRFSQAGRRQRFFSLQSLAGGWLLLKQTLVSYYVTIESRCHHRLLSAPVSCGTENWSKFKHHSTLCRKTEEVNWTSFFCNWKTYNPVISKQNLFHNLILFEEAKVVFNHSLFSSCN